MPKIRSWSAAQDWRIVTGEYNNDNKTNAFERKVRWLAEHPGLHSDNFQRWLFSRVIINVIALTHASCPVPCGRKQIRNNRALLAEIVAGQRQNHSYLSDRSSASFLPEIEVQNVRNNRGEQAIPARKRSSGQASGRSQKSVSHYTAAAQRREQKRAAVKDVASPAERNQGGDVILPLIMASTAHTLSPHYSALRSKTFITAAAAAAIAGGAWIGREIFRAMHAGSAEVEPGLTGQITDMPYQAKPLADKHHDSPNTWAEEWQIVTHGFSGLKLNEDITDYSRIRLLSRPPRSTEEIFDKRYLKTEKAFRSLMQDDIVQIVDTQEVNRPFHDYIKQLTEAVIKHDYVKVTTGNTSQLLITPALAIIYNTLLSDILIFDRNAYYGIYREEEILLFLRLKYTLKHLILYINQQQNAPCDEIVRQPRYRYHLPLTSLEEKNDFINEVASSRLHPDSAILSNYHQAIKYYGDGYDISDIILVAYDSILSEMNRLLTLPVSISHEKSALNEYINNCTWVLQRLQPYFGNLYRYDGENQIDTTLSSGVKTRMMNCSLLFETFGTANLYKDVIRSVFSRIDFSTLTDREAFQQQRNNHRSDSAVALLKKYKKLLSESLLPAWGGSKLSNNSQTDPFTSAAADYLLTSMREMIAANKESYARLSAEKKGILDRFCQAAPGNLPLSSPDIQNIITDTFVYQIVPALFADERQRLNFPVSLLSRLSGFDIEKIYSASENELLRSGEFNKVKQKSLALYNDETLRWIEYGIYLFTNQNVSDTSKSLIDILSLSGESNAISDVMHQIKETQNREEELLMFSDFTLALGFLNKDIERDDTLLSFSEKVVLAAIKDFEKIKKDLEERVYAYNTTEPESEIALNELRRGNLILLSLRNEYSERLDIVRYLNDIIAFCRKREGVYISPYLPVGYGSSVNFAKIAAIRHFYKRMESGRKNDTLYLNMYNALIYNNSPEACHLRILSALYWVIFYHPLFHRAANELINNLNKKMSALSAEKDHLYLRKTRALLTYASSSKLVRLFDLYTLREKKETVLIEQALGYDNLKRDYFSIADIKRRSSFPDHSAEKFAEQFQTYQPDKDISALISQFVEKTAINVGKLLLNPKAVYTYRHLNKVSDKMAPPGRDDDLIIFFTQDNQILLSWASGFYHQALSFDTKDDRPGFEDISVVINDLAPYALGYRAKAKSKQESMARLRKSVLGMLSFRYGVNNLNHYNLTEVAYPEHLVINLSLLENKPEFGVISDERVDMALFQRTAVNCSGSINDILKIQLGNYLAETLESLKVIYNDEEDTTDRVINFIPFASAIRKAWNHLPLSSQDIVFVVMDLVTLGADISFDVASGALKSSLRKLVREEVEKEFVAGEKMSFKTFARITQLSLKKFMKSSGFLTRSVIKSLANATPLPLITQSYRILTRTNNLLASGSYSSLAEISNDFNKAKKITNGIVWKKLNAQAEGTLFKNRVKKEGEKLPAILAMDNAEASALYHEIESYLASDNHLELFNRYHDKISLSLPRIMPGEMNREQVIAHTLNKGYRLYFNAGDDLHRLTDAERDTASKARGGVNRAVIKSQKVKTILDSLFRPSGQYELRQSLEQDIKVIVGEINQQHIADILHTLSVRNTLVLNLLENLRSNRFHDLIYFRTATDSPVPCAFVYPKDQSRAIFYNLKKPLLTPDKVFLHELSHHASTGDALYQVFYPGVLRSTREMVASLRKPKNLRQFRGTIPARAINVLFGLPREAPVGIAHYETAYGIVHSPDFPVQLLKTNADSYVDLVELINRKYAVAVDEAGQIKITINHVGKREASDKEVSIPTQEMLGLAWLLAGKMAENANLAPAS